MFKKLKGNKGFTLIELIVVIAILAILALIIVPRFLGFTDNAKIAADNAAVETIEKAVMAMVASGTIKPDLAADATITINKTGTTYDLGGTGILKDASDTNYTDATIKTAIEKMTDKVSAQAEDNNGFLVTITSASAITVDLN
jgi:prepilin-type N-terminal cleavage/methylation domain-containing protein